MGGGETYTLKAGRKKWAEAHLSNNPANPWGLHRFNATAHVPSQSGKHITKVAEKANGHSMKPEPGQNRPDATQT